MKKQYALGIERTNREPYCIPMSLECIDQIILEYRDNLGEILEIIHEQDSVMNETDPSRIKIKGLIRQKWKTLHQVPIITDPLILYFSVPELFQKLPKKEGYLRDLENHFQKNIKQNSTSVIFKESLQNSSLLENWEKLPYEEQRLIRVYLASKIPIVSYLQEENIEQTITEIETLEMETKPEENPKLIRLMKEKDAA